jgi:hypothetical protein
MVQLGRHGPLYCIYNLSSGWKGYHIWLLAGYKERSVQGFWKLSAIVSDDTSSFMHTKLHIKFVVDTSGFHTALTESTWKTPSAMIGGPRRRSMAQNCAWGENSQYVSRMICATTSCMLSLCPNDYVLHISCMQCAKQPEGSVLCGLWVPQGLWQLPPELAAVQEITIMVAKGKGGQ